MSIFSKVSFKRPKRTPFNMSYQSKFTLDFGKLCPIMCEKVVPGDKFVHSHEFLMRFAPFVNQVFQGFQVRTDYFFVPSRLLWENFESFLVNGVSGSNEYIHPFLDLATIYDGETSFINTLLDYFNLPTGSTNDYIDGSATNSLKIDALPFYAYVKILLDYYLDENLFPSDVSPDLIDTLLNTNFAQQVYDGSQYDAMFSIFTLMHHVQGVDTSSPLSWKELLQPFKRSYPKDYFTSALPFAQRGPIVQIPLNGQGDVIVKGDMVNNRSYHGVGIQYHPSVPYSIENGVDVTLFPLGQLSIDENARNSLDIQSDHTTSNYNDVSSWGQLSQADEKVAQTNAVGKALSFKAVNVNGTATITDLRTAMTVQAWLEKNARAGVRYKEQLMSHFGVRSKDYRLDRAELLGHYKSTVQIGETFTTAANTDGTFIPGMGVSNATGSEASRSWKRTFDEHGYVIGLMSVFPTAAYYQGIPRQFMELDCLDYYWPEFQNIGEQDIKNCELYIDSESGLRNMETFGYTPRYAHYKSRYNQLHGDFRDSLTFMTAARKFSTAPNLNNKFIQVDVDYNDLYRVFNADTELADASPVYVDMYHKFYAKRPMQYFGSPRII